MLIPTPTRILLCLKPVDFRKSIDGLVAVCEIQLEENPLDGTLFVFTNKSRRAVKILVWSYGGFIMLYKKLEQGRFRWPKSKEDRVRLTPAVLAGLMEGFDLSNARRLKRWNPKEKSDNASTIG